LTKYSIPILILYIFTSSCSTKKVAGKYQTNFAAYGMFQKILTINCDSTFVLNFNGDLMNDNSYGKWNIKNDSLILNFDSINYPKSRYSGISYYSIKRNKLTSYFPFTKEKYNELKMLIEKAGITDSLNLGSYRKFKKNHEKTSKNFYGKMGKQYFKKIEKFECENNN
jgi:hypothetical protein